MSDVKYDILWRSMDFHFRKDNKIDGIWLSNTCLNKVYENAEKALKNFNEDIENMGELYDLKIVNIKKGFAIAFNKRTKTISVHWLEKAMVQD